MAIISTKGIYGLIAIVILAKETKDELLSIKQIAQKGNIPQNYLEQILVVMKKNGIITSIRGANGGYKLAKCIKDITVYDVLNSLECCLEYKKQQPSMLDPFWEYTHDNIKKIFSLNIDELIVFLDNNSNNLIYHI